MKKLFFVCLIGFCSSVICSCVETTKQQPVEEKNVEVAVMEEPKVKTIFNVLDKSELFVNPSKGEKVINQKATNALGYIKYCVIDPSCTVKILEQKDDWVKIQVVSPDWLQRSHIGWVESKIIEIEDCQPINLVENKDYKILYKEVQGNITNYYVQNISCVLTQSDLLQFAKALKKDFNCNCNIYIYEDASVKNLMTKYPLKGDDYLKVADKYAFELFFDGTYGFYPFQDVQYRDLGGSNWKKAPIK